MLLSRRATTGLLAALVLGAPMAVAQVAKTSFKFDFGPGQAAPGYIRVPADTVYGKELGYGFEPGAAIQSVDRVLTSDKPFLFSVAVPEGNYRWMWSSATKKANAPPRLRPSRAG